MIIYFFLIGFLLGLAESNPCPWVKPEPCECKEGQKLLPADDCPYYKTEKDKLGKLTPKTPEFIKVRCGLVSLVCTQKPQITLCCPQPDVSPVSAGEY